MISRPPRTVPISRQMKWLLDRPIALFFGLFFGIFPLCVLLPILLFLDWGVFTDVDYQKVLSEGTTVEGKIVRIETDYKTTVNGVHPVILHYRYAVAGQDRTGKMKTLDLDIVDEWEKGQGVTVKYLDSQSMITEVEPFKFPFWIFYAFMAIYPLIGIPGIVYSYLGARKKTRLYREGLMRTGKIVAMEPTGWATFLPFLKTRFRITYSLGDRGVYGSSITMDLALINEKKRGDDVNILCLPQNEGINCLAEDRILLECAGRA